MNTLTTPGTAAVLERLFAAADLQELNPAPWPLDTPYADASAKQRADALAGEYMPISRSGGRLLYALARHGRPETIVEFGTSYAISTIHLAAAVADNGVGHVWTTELSQTKVDAARENLARAGVAEHVTILAGDALSTLAEVRGPIGLLLLDGWKDLCLPVLRLLEDRLAPAALIVADDTTFASMADYLAYVRDPAHGYVTITFPVEDGMEISCRT
ncbi:class I SAM-dependent methyltransferase [Sphaerisporangium sp. TRM90804]|uniref:O-methyltransferase n=1 Tax=Sphaerisporangium sp. TRM90804 TaxID=3031113 RepID=UPI00244BE07F|nr:class I SAM-dependent methyltransferase [Sphaerisporangium sp. TRM90804]MDH2430612.1 class I SAM-dependent methyltransferase [Sphaerisporangium sp. TRM90804]